MTRNILIKYDSMSPSVLSVILSFFKTSFHRIYLIVIDIYCHAVLQIKFFLKHYFFLDTKRSKALQMGNCAASSSLISISRARHHITPSHNHRTLTDNNGISFEVTLDKIFPRFLCYTEG